MAFKTVGRYDDDPIYSGILEGSKVERDIAIQLFDKLEEEIRSWSNEERIRMGKNIVYAIVEFIDENYSGEITPEQFVWTFFACATELGCAGLDPIPQSKKETIAEFLSVITNKNDVLESDHLFDWRQFRDKDHQMLVDCYLGPCPDPIHQNYPLSILTYMLLASCADTVNENGIKAAKYVWTEYLDLLDKRSNNPDYTYTGTYNRDHFTSFADNEAEAWECEKEEKIDPLEEMMKRVERELEEIMKREEG